MEQEELMSDDLYKNEFEAKLARAERKWEFRYQQQWKKQKELEATVAKLRKKIRELKND
tara:strand:- start:281 stop:457 length:177 start_codon:yes stop_codon:yes gene_type:complete